MGSITGWVKLHRQFIEWEWYDDINTKVLFIHCLIKANHKDKTWRGNEIKRGTFITSLKNLSNETGLTVQQVRTSFDKLESTGEINKRSTSVNTWVTINKYDDYQDNNKEVTNQQQTSNKRVTTTKNEKNEKNEKEVNIEFEVFWDAYDKKVGSKQKANKYWDKLKDSERERIMEYIKPYKASFEDSQYQPYATTFLNQKYFEAEEYAKNKNSVNINMDRFI